ncbi:uncharacterized protein DEA37_0011216, partial [Paragonimus westermani]
MKLTVCLFILVWCVCSVQMRSFSYHPIYQNDGMPTVYKMPKRHSMQLKVFIECRRDCSNKCNHSLFAFLSHENECFTCLLECMSAFTQQAEKVGVSDCLPISQRLHTLFCLLQTSDCLRPPVGFCIYVRSV